MPRAATPSDGEDKRAESIEHLLAQKEIVIACGSGGVGKTTTAAAAAAMAAVRHRGKVLVVTVDPARRLADALGVERIGNEERRVPNEAFAAAGIKPRGQLWAAMLDTKQSWDALVRRHAPDADTRERILSNPLYKNISGKFVQSHDYIAMERLYEIHSSGDYDLIVVDTPPTRNAIDFIEAPRRMADFFSSKLLRLLTAPYRSRMVNLASKPFYQVADRILGSQFLEDIAEFFILFQTMYPGFVERASAVERLLRDRRTTFVVVSTLEASPVTEAEFFVQVLKAKRYHLGGLILNRALPESLLDEEGADLAARLADTAASLAEIPGVAAALSTDSGQLARVLSEMGVSYGNFATVARREAGLRTELRLVPDVVVTVPDMAEDIHDLESLLRLGEPHLGRLMGAGLIWARMIWA